MGTIVEFPDRSELSAEAAEWLIRLDGDTPLANEELTALGQWLRRSPAHRAELENFAALWGRMNILTELAVPLAQPRGASVGDRFSRVLATWRLPLQLAGALAAVLATLAAMFMLSTNHLLKTNGTYATTVGQQKTVTLADGSQLLLNTNSRVKVDYGDQYRRVYLLQGEVLFTVAKNRKLPFRVYAGTGLIEAVGTAFSVYLKETNNVAVTVAEGRVSLASVREVQPGSVPPASIRQGDAGSNQRDGSVKALGVLSAGQAATIRSSMDAPTTSHANLLEEAAPLTPAALADRLAWRDGILVFSGEPLEAVVKELSRYTTMSIEISDASIRNMRVAGRFPVGETETMLAALETNFNVRVVRLNSDRVVLVSAEH